MKSKIRTVRHVAGMDSRKFRSKSSARHEMEVCSQLHAPTYLFPRKQRPLPTEYDAGWSPELVKVKVKLKMSLCFFNWAPRHEGVLGSTGTAPRILDLGTRWSEWSASRPGRFTPRERAPVTHWTGGWVGPRAVLDAVVKRKIPRPRQESNPSTPIVQPVTQRYTDWAVTYGK
jgi:hypothetical protein